VASGCVLARSRTLRNGSYMPIGDYSFQYGKVERWALSLGPMANTPFLSPLIKSDKPIPASGFPSDFTVQRDRSRRASHAVPSQTATSRRKTLSPCVLPPARADSSSRLHAPPARGRLAVVDRRVAGGTRWNRRGEQAGRTARQALGCSQRAERLGGLLARADSLLLNRASEARAVASRADELLSVRLFGSRVAAVRLSASRRNSAVWLCNFEISPLSEIG
jgi:hypothetical protein